MISSMKFYAGSKFRTDESDKFLLIGTFNGNTPWIWPQCVILKNINIAEENRLVILFKTA